MCRIESIFLIQRLKGCMSGDARDFNNIEKSELSSSFFFWGVGGGDGGKASHHRKFTPF